MDRVLVSVCCNLVAIDTVFSVDKLFKAVTADRFYCLQCASHSLVAIDL